VSSIWSHAQAAAFAGLILVIVAASPVVVERWRLQRIIDSDLSDILDAQCAQVSARQDASRNPRIGAVGGGPGYL
jgi:hypothetical protein